MIPSREPAQTIDLPDDGIEVWRFARRPRERSTPRVREVLGACLGCEPERVPLVRGTHGRPELAAGVGPEAPGFSASHAGDWLLVAVARGVQPGIDVEALRPRPLALDVARRYFTAAEADALEALDGVAREQRFYRLWVAREAVLKALGRGLAFGLDRLRIDPDPEQPRLEWIDGDAAPAWQLRWLELPAGYLGALAWRGGPRRLRCRGPCA